MRLAVVQTMQGQRTYMMPTTILHTNPHSVDDKNWLFTVVCAVVGHRTKQQLLNRIFTMTGYEKTSGIQSLCGVAYHLCYGFPAVFFDKVAFARQSCSLELVCISEQQVLCSFSLWISLHLCGCKLHRSCLSQHASAGMNSRYNDGHTNSFRISSATGGR